jgi:hypothetical protein
MSVCVCVCVNGVVKQQPVNNEGGWMSACGVGGGERGQKQRERKKIIGTRKRDTHSKNNTTTTKQRSTLTSTHASCPFMAAVCNGVSPYASATETLSLFCKQTYDGIEV